LALNDTLEAIEGRVTRWKAPSRSVRQIVEPERSGRTSSRISDRVVAFCSPAPKNDRLGIKASVMPPKKALNSRCNPVSGAQNTDTFAHSHSSMVRLSWLSNTIEFYAPFGGVSHQIWY
jgi:hypothetical protein